MGHLANQQSPNRPATYSLHLHHSHRPSRRSPLHLPVLRPEELQLHPQKRGHLPAMGLAKHHHSHKPNQMGSLCIRPRHTTTTAPNPMAWFSARQAQFLQWPSGRIHGRQHQKPNRNCRPRPLLRHLTHRREPIPRNIPPPH